MSFIELFRTLYDIIQNILFILRSYIAEFFFFFWRNLPVFDSCWRFHNFGSIFVFHFGDVFLLLGMIDFMGSFCFVYVGEKREKLHRFESIHFKHWAVVWEKSDLKLMLLCTWIELSLRFFLFTLMYWYYQPYCRARDIRAKIIRFTLSKWFSFCFACFFVFTGNRNHYPLYLELQHI